WRWRNHSTRQGTPPKISRGSRAKLNKSAPRRWNGCWVKAGSEGAVRRRITAEPACRGNHRQSFQTVLPTARASPDRGKPEAGSGAAAFVSPQGSNRQELKRSG